MEQRPDKPRSEPEIIPPGEADARPRRGDARIWSSVDGRQRIYVARLGPFGFAMVALAVAVIAALVFLLVLGAFVIFIPLVGLLLAAVVITSMLRGSFRR
jgi:ABC-type transport system involved in cytochrome bd biosynthesis fused ATPase/permease subunit